MAETTIYIMNLYRVPALRKIALPLLRRFGSRDIVIRHHYVSKQFHLHAFKHKGYWYHGKQRERKTMVLFHELIGTGDLVIEVGAHIGYMSLYFSWLVGSRGSVHVFEPGVNNLPYLERNTTDEANITIVRKAIGNYTGMATFFVENLTGQNNSLNRDYQPFKQNASRAFSDAEYSETRVEVTTLDQYVNEHQLKPNFIKVDIEGEEISALQGMQETLDTFKPMLMVEVTRKETDVFNLLSEHGYLLMNENRQRIKHVRELAGNTFGLHHSAHSEQISTILNQ